MDPAKLNEAIEVMKTHEFAACPRNLALNPPRRPASRLSPQCAHSVRPMARVVREGAGLLGWVRLARGGGLFKGTPVYRIREFPFLQSPGRLANTIDSHCYGMTTKELKVAGSDLCEFQTPTPSISIGVPYTRMFVFRNPALTAVPKPLTEE